MPYVPITIADECDLELAAVVRASIERYFRELRWLFVLRRPDGGEGKENFQFIAALGVVSAIAACSELLYGKAGGTGILFKGALVVWYPWDLDPPSDGTKERAAEALYNIYRNPLAHRAGIRKPGKPVKIGQRVGMNDNAVADLERSTVRPYGKPAVILAADRYVLWADGLYWGARIMVQRMLADPACRTRAAERIATGGYLPERR